MKRYYLLLILIGLSNSMVPTRAENYIQDPSGDYQSVGPTSPNTEAPQLPEAVREEISQGIEWLEGEFGLPIDVLAAGNKLKACQDKFGAPDDKTESNKSRSCTLDGNCKIDNVTTCKCGEKKDNDQQRFCQPVPK